MNADVLWMGYEEGAEKMLFDRMYRIDRIPFLDPVDPVKALLILVLLSGCFSWRRNWTRFRQNR